MSAELTLLLQQKFVMLNHTPFTIVSVVVNTPEDEQVNDVTVYINKESATTVETLSENQLLNLGHEMLEAVSLQLVAPEKCSFHLVYQFFDTAVAEYEGDSDYFVGDYWETENGFWIAKTFLDLFYDEQQNDALIYHSWLGRWKHSFRPLESSLLAFIEDGGFESFLYTILETPAFTELEAQTVTIDTLAHGFRRCTIEANWPPNTLERHEHKAIVYGYQLFLLAVRFYKRRTRKVWLKINIGDHEVISFEKHNQRCWYSTWLDEEPVRLDLTTPVIFNGRAKRELKKYLQRQLTWHLRAIKVTDVKVFDKDEFKTVVTLGGMWAFWVDRVVNQILKRGQRVIWDIHQYYQQPKKCVLELRHKKYNWTLSVRMDERQDNYRIIPWTRSKKYEVRVFEKRSLLTKKNELFQKDWNKYRYQFTPNQIEE